MPLGRVSASRVLGLPSRLSRGREEEYYPTGEGRPHVSDPASGPQRLRGNAPACTHLPAAKTALPEYASDVAHVRVRLISGPAKCDVVLNCAKCA